MVGHLNDHVGRNVGKQKSAVDCMHAFLKCVNEALNLPNMFIPSHLIQADTKVSQVTAHGLKLTIHFGSHDVKASMLVHAHN